MMFVDSYTVVSLRGGKDIIPAQGNAARQQKRLPVLPRSVIYFLVIGTIEIFIDPKNLPPISEK
jgi:hypothetical protein